MKYYLIPIEELRFEDDDKMMQIFLKNVFPTIYRKYKENYAVNSLILKELEKNNLPTHFLFQTNKHKRGKKTTVTEVITEIQFDFPNFYLLDKKVSKAQALFYLTNLTKEQMISIIQSLYHYVYDEETKVKKIIPFPSKIAK